jgi:hypothetical protein
MSHIPPLTAWPAPQMINIRSTLRTATDLCKNVSLAVLFGGNGNSYTVCTVSDMFIYTHILHTIETLVG